MMVRTLLRRVAAALALARATSLLTRCRFVHVPSACLLQARTTSSTRCRSRAVSPFASHASDSTCSQSRRSHRARSVYRSDDQQAAAHWYAFFAHSAFTLCDCSHLCAIQAQLPSSESCFSRSSMLISCCQAWCTRRFWARRSTQCAVTVPGSTETRWERACSYAAKLFP